jgi:hypothetical protein
MKTLIFIPIILFISSCTGSSRESQTIMSDESEKQTKLLEEQVKQLTRIADALEGDTTRWKSHIIKSKP